MDFSSFTDSAILITSGVIIFLFGAGKLFPKLGNQESPDKMKSVSIIGLVVVVAGTFQLVRHLL